jgi:aspartate-semialdehyde dehydrogenase
MKRVGIVGWRGMVGSVLMDRMLAEGDFAEIPEVVFFTTSQAGQPGPDVGRGAQPLEDAGSIEALREMDLILTCQVRRVGAATGSTRRRRCGWSQTRQSFWTP